MTVPTVATFPLNGDAGQFIVSTHPSRGSHTLSWPDVRSGDHGAIWIIADAAPRTLPRCLVGRLVGSQRIELGTPTSYAVSMTVSGYDRVSSPVLSSQCPSLACDLYRKDYLRRSDDIYSVITLHTYQAEHPSAAAASTVCTAYVITSDLIGFVLCKKSALTAYAHSTQEHDLLGQFTTTEDGNNLMSAGALVPFLGMHAWSYRLVLLDQPAPDEVVSVFGKQTVPPRYYRIDSDDDEPFIVIEGSALEHWPPSQPIATLNSIRSGTYRFRGFASGPHGEEWLPTIMGERIDSDEPLSEPWINLDPTEMYGEVGETSR